ncbi:Multidrug resistance protein Stp [Methanosarcinaceae archaeon Ag5]|uniref:Multidrug resistance protein Stp n=1 Tax=Methanolapillus africanus TaxID=3028297 RepID=A0AAE4SD32_9EURY|nr:Multidrug resistance protein Stp [Methanosarcinaceae archaeon Ag5]
MPENAAPQPPAQKTESFSTKGYTKTQLNLILLGFALSAFVLPLSSMMINVALPAIGATYSVGAHQLGWLTTTSLLAVALFLVPFARLSDIYGRKKIFTIGTIIFLIATIATPSASTYGILVICRVLTGIGLAGVSATSMSLLTHFYEGAERLHAYGIVTATGALGAAVGPAIGGFLVQQYNWQSSFYFIVPFALVSGILVYAFVKGDIRFGKGEPFDWGGSLLYALALLFTLGGLSSLPNTWAIISTIVGIIMIPAFIYYEKRQKYPAMNVKLFSSNKVFAWSNYAVVFIFTATYALSFFLSLYLQSIGNLTSQEAGFIMLSIPAVQIVISPLIGKISKRISQKNITIMGTVLTIIGLICLTTISETTSLALIIIYGILIGAGTIFFILPNTNTLMSSVSAKDYSNVSAITGVFRQSGMVLSMVIAMANIAIFFGTTNTLTPDTYPEFLTAMHVTFIVGIVFAVIAGLLIIFRDREEKKEEKDGKKPVTVNEDEIVKLGPEPVFDI